MIEVLREIDRQLFHIVNSGMANSFLDVVAPVLRNKLTWIPLYLLLAFFFYRRYGLKVLWLVLATGLVILLSDQLSSSVIKPWVKRIRPCNNPEMEARLLLDHCGAGFSFVSSHAANHFGLAAFFSFFAGRRHWTVLLFIWAALISFSQVYVGVHFPADVLGGGLLGVLIGFITGFITKRYFTQHA